MHGLTGNNPANDPDKKPVKSHSLFKPNFSLFQTALFGYNTPFLGFEVTGDDNVSIRVASDVDTFTMKAPVMAPVKMNKDYFFARLRSIAPNNAELLITNPLSGDDVVAESVNTVLHTYDLATTFDPVCDLLCQAINGDSSLSTSVKFFRHLIISALHFYQCTWWFCSKGAPCRNLGYNLHTLFKGPYLQSLIGQPRLSYDKFLELLFSTIFKHVSSFQVKISDSVAQDNSYNTPQPLITYKTYYVSTQSRDARPFSNWISFHHLLELIQQGGTVVEVSALSASNLVDPADTTIEVATEMDVTGTKFLYITVASDPASTANVSSSDKDSCARVNLWSLIGYQLVSASFYSNDAIDYVYNPHLWHDNMMALYRMYDSNYTSNQCFYYNGMLLPYDSCSGTIIKRFLSGWPNTFATNLDYPSVLTVSDYEQLVLGLAYFTNIFSFTRTLRYRDYFVGSKPRPMAVGDVDVQVNSGQFSVVDVTKNIQRQRFLNQVNRVGRSFKEYIQGINGSTPAADPRDVVFLGSSTDVIGASETENTADAQYQSPSGITSKFRNDSSRFAFEGSFSEQGVVIGIVNFDITRPFEDAAFREVFHIDRFDMFNPYLQTIGDQAVSGSEMNLNQPFDNFGYQLRYSEYKQRFDIAAGGFSDFLPGYAFLLSAASLSRPGSNVFSLSPDFIRSHTFDFDQFYLDISNNSPAGYFHFILRHDITIDANRPMLAAPSIL